MLSGFIFGIIVSGAVYYVHLKGLKATEAQLTAMEARIVAQFNKPNTRAP